VNWKVVAEIFYVCDTAKMSNHGQRDINGTVIYLYRPETTRPIIGYLKDLSHLVLLSQMQKHSPFNYVAIICIPKILHKFPSFLCDQTILNEPTGRDCMGRERAVKVKGFYPAKMAINKGFFNILLDLEFDNPISQTLKTTAHLRGSARKLFQI